MFFTENSLPRKESVSNKASYRHATFTRESAFAYFTHTVNGLRSGPNLEFIEGQLIGYKPAR